MTDTKSSEVIERARKQATQIRLRHSWRKFNLCQRDDNAQS